MARTYLFGRQQAEDLVDLLEANPDFQLHDQTAMEMAAELRELFGMRTRADELKHLAETSTQKFVEVRDVVVLPQFYEGDFSPIQIPPATP